LFWITQYTKFYLEIIGKFDKLVFKPVEGYNYLKINRLINLETLDISLTKKNIIKCYIIKQIILR